MVQIFAVFADDSNSTKIETAEIFNSPVGTELSRALSQN